MRSNIILRQIYLEVDNNRKKYSRDSDDPIKC